MKKRWNIDYDLCENNFDKIRNVNCKLILGTPNDKAFISYVIPVYKRADLLEKTLYSVLNQQKVDFEWNIVIVDNEAGEVNDTQRLIEKISSDKIVYYRNEENIGVDGNYNRCIEIAKSPWVAMIHGDDLIMDDHLKKSYEYIKYIEGKGSKRELAYICQRYIDFSDETGINLHRQDNAGILARYSYELSEIYNNDKPQLQPQIVGVITGYYASIPSFGTIMNREILIKEGGFSDNLGICEDVITPFKLARKYDVYLAPVYMGFHRFDRNESMKTETIMKIYCAMIEFREYMYSTVWWGKIWGNIARDILNDGLRNYCIGQSRFCNTRLKEEDFDRLYKIKDYSILQRFLVNIVMLYARKKYDLGDNKKVIERYISSCYEQIDNALKNKRSILIYGAGMATRELIPILEKKFTGINIIGCAVSDVGKKNKINKYMIKTIDEYAANSADVAVITSTITWEYQVQMNERLEQLGFDNIINLLV